MELRYFLPIIVAFLIPIVAIIGGISVAIASIISKGKLRELQIRERIALIEKGLVPPPEVDPAGFDRAMSRHERSTGSGHGMKPALRRAGIMLMSVGLGLVLLISVAGSSVRTGVGVGGFLVIVGFAFLVNSLLESHDQPTPKPLGPDAPTTRRG